MNATRKRRSWLNLASETEALLKDAFLKRPMAWLADAQVKIRNLPKTNFDLGCDFFDRGQWVDAAFRFRVTAYLQPGFAKAWYNLGCCYFRLGKLPEAERALRRALALKPSDQEAILMMAMVAPNALPVNQRPQSLPQAMVSSFFSGVASRYDAFELQNQYRGGIAVEQQIRPLIGSRMLNIIDLGCGSGIAARPWRGSASQIIGVDFTPTMVAQSETVSINNQKLYDAVVLGDARALPDSFGADGADLVLVVNVSQFVGELSGLMRSAARVLKQGGILAITVEPFSSQTGFGLTMDGRFGHSAAYVKQVAADAGLVLAKDASIALYPSRNSTLLAFSKGQR